MKCLLKYRWVKLPRAQLPQGKGVLGYASPGLRDKTLQATASLYQGQGGAVGSLRERQFPG